MSGARENKRERRQDSGSPMHPVLVRWGEGEVCPDCSPVITVRRATKTAPATHAVTTFPLVLNEIRSVAAFSPIFQSMVLPGGINQRLSA